MDAANARTGACRHIASAGQWNQNLGRAPVVVEDAAEDGQNYKLS